RKGVTLREVWWESPKGKQIRVKITRMASFAETSLFLVRYELEPLNFNGSAQLTSVHRGDVKNFFDPDDPRVAGEEIQHILIGKTWEDEGASYILSNTSKSGGTVCSAVKNLVEEPECLTGTSRSLDEGLAEETFTAQVEAGKCLHLMKYTVLCDSCHFSDPAGQAKEKLERLLRMPAGELYRDQERYLDAFWDNCQIDVYGDGELNRALTYNVYQLLQSVTKDRYGNIAAKGLSGEGYEGHYFWDTEMYILPFFTLTNREIAKNLIGYRYQILENAKENARAMGHKQGALYPWRTIMGSECSGYFPSGTAAYHISGDVAYAVISYYLATGDLEFMEQCGAEIVVETARLWMDMGSWYQGKFHINEVTGPDEYTCMVNNNYYTNVLARYNLNWAARLYRKLSEAGKASGLVERTGMTQEEAGEFVRTAEAIFLPYDEELGINPQDDSFLQKKMWDVSSIPEEDKPLLLHHHPLELYRYQVCKQADTVLAHFILEEEQDLETIRRSYAYYEKVTTHDSSLSSCIFSIMAARLGMVDKAYRYFGDSAKMDLYNTHKNTKDGIHTANMGGSYMGIVYGFGGLRIREQGLSLRPCLPKQWEGYHFRFLYEDSVIEVKVCRETCAVELLRGTPKEISVYDRQYRLSGRLEIAMM
ncbi:MAG: family 65 glycosyl hydrolase, partial [Clostridium sp.]|nr:family 65 glycosyl hydrolase [Clostridium sp.]